MIWFRKYRLKRLRKLYVEFSRKRCYWDELYAAYQLPRYLSNAQKYKKECERIYRKMEKLQRKE